MTTGTGRVLARALLASAWVAASAAMAVAQTSSQTPPAGHQHPTSTGEAGPAGQAPAAPAPAAPPLFEDLGSFHRAITTASPEAQRWFDQGLRLMYAFNLEEAQRSFEEAARRDPDCASCFWGVALALGPHINFAAQADRTRAAWRAVGEARAAAARTAAVTPVERALIEALARRYADPPPATGDTAGFAKLDRAYADAMGEVARRFPDDLDVATLYAEALMDLRPWDLWTQDGRPQPGTAEIVATLERVLAKNPDHPGANHFYIHAVEASPHPEKALAAAGRLAGLMPGAAHIVHMPAHIYMRVGRYGEAAEANRRAIRVDEAYVARSPGALGGFYAMYFGHNYQFLWSAALMEGRGEEALGAARQLVAMVPAEMLAQMPGFDFGLGYPWWTLARLRRWDELLREPAPPDGFPYARAIWHVTRGLALSAQGKRAEAEAELAAAHAQGEKIPAEALEGLNPARALLAVAEGVLAGDLAARRGDVDEAVRRLQAAAEAEDGLRYNEPPDWYTPVRHVLGEVLLAADRAAAAQAVYEADLARNPENGWALAGLAESLRRQSKEAEAAAVRARFEKAWARADVTGPAALRR
jgi:tetratricopeptide (TPR) repeat protein